MNSFKDTGVGREFLAGKCYLRVSKEEWAEFARRCAAEGIKWRWGVPVREIGSALHGNDGPIYAFMNKRGLDSYGPEATCTTDKPIHPFSALCAEREKPATPYDGVGKHKVGDRFVVVPSDHEHPRMRVGDVVELVEDDQTACPWFRIVGKSDRWPVYWKLLKPVAAAPARRKIIITTDGTTTTARLMEGKTTIRTATATCSQIDTFDFDQGARLAFDRLINDGKCRDLHVRVDIDTSAAQAAIQSVIDALNDLPNRVKAVRK